MEEHAAQLAWRIRRPARRQPVPAHIVVKVDEGFGVLEELYFDDLPVLDYMRKMGIWPPSDASPAGTEVPAPVDPEQPLPATDADADAEDGAKNPA